MVRVASLAAAAALAGSALAAPFKTAALEKRANIDIVVLQFALTLEHLENTFYKKYVQEFDAAAFEAAGYSADYYNNLLHITYDEQTHVETLEATLKSLGVKPVAPCTYDFPVTDVASFIAFSSVVENVGTSAYLGAAQLITSDYYLEVAGAILAVEAHHTSYQRAALGEIPFPNPFQTPLDPMSVFTIASSVITSCPKSNYKLPFTAFASLAVDGTYGTCEEPDCSSPSVYIKRWGSSASPPSAGTTVTFTASGTIKAGSYLTFVNGLAVSSVAGDISGTSISGAIPSTIYGGQTYVFVTSKDINGDFSDFSDAVVAYGPAIIEVNPPAPDIDYSEY